MLSPLPVNPLFSVANLNLTKIWHCFGNYMHKANLETIIKMLDASRANVLPINTHALTENNGLDGLQIGFDGVKLKQLADKINIDDMTLMLNINHQLSAEAAVNKTKMAYALLQEPVIKLEVLNSDLKTSNNEELIQAVIQLQALLPQLIVMPLISNDYQTAQKLVELGCPLLRVMGSDIGDAQGILDPNGFARICTLPVPIVLDGGVRHAQDFAHAQQLGAAGCLVNSVLFSTSTSPDIMLAKFLSEAQSCFSSALPI